VTSSRCRGARSTATSRLNSGDVYLFHLALFLAFIHEGISGLAYSGRLIKLRRRLVMPQLVTFHLNQLRCIVESDAQGGSEPYLWVTYFVVDGRNVAQPEPVSTDTPIFGFNRKETPDDIRDGQIVKIPPFIANFSAQIDPGPLNLMMAGCVAVLLEEDETPEKAIQGGQRAYADAIHQELNNLIKERIRTQNRESVTEHEVKAIRNAIEPKIKLAIRSNLTLGQKLFDNQDDFLGFAHIAFIDDEIRTTNFNFPELMEPGSENRFALSGSLTVGPVPTPPVDRCADLRAAVQAMRAQVTALHGMLVALQEQLKKAPPQQKPAIIQQIEEVGAKIVKAEEELRLRASLVKTCETGVIDLLGPAVEVGDERKEI
jgi:hypothetical protein